jgi:hypothetical protein
LFNTDTWASKTTFVLQFYAPIALAANRMYWALITVAISAAVSRCGLHIQSSGGERNF